MRTVLPQYFLNSISSSQICGTFKNTIIPKANLCYENSWYYFHYRDLQNHLVDQGFTVIESEDNPLTIVTQYQTFSPLIFGILGSYSKKITATVNDSSTHFTGSLNSGIQVENSGSKNTSLRSGWNKMVEVAQRFPHKEIYLRRN